MQSIKERSFEVRRDASVFKEGLQSWRKIRVNSGSQRDRTQKDDEGCHLALRGGKTRHRLAGRRFDWAKRRRGKKTRYLIGTKSMAIGRKGGVKRNLNTPCNRRKPGGWAHKNLY